MLFDKGGTIGCVFYRRKRNSTSVEKGLIKSVPRVRFSSRWAARSVAQNPNPDDDLLGLTRGPVNANTRSC